MYTSEHDLKTLNIGDVIDVTFKNKSKVKKDYLGKTIRFFINNIFDYSFYDPYRRIAIIPLDKFENFTNKDALIVDQTDRFSCLMIDLYPENRIPYSGWKNKIVNIKLVDTIEIPKLEIPKPDFTFNKNLEFNHTGIWYHMKKYSFMSNLWGGTHEDNISFLKKHEGNPKLKMNGFIINDIPVDWIANAHDFLWQYLSLSLTFGDKKKIIYSPIITEYEEEFCIRREALMNKVLEYISRNKYDRYKRIEGMFAVWDYATNLNNSELFEKCLDNFEKEDEKNILTNSLDYLNYKKERGW
jgi:hypothetical protein